LADSHNSLGFLYRDLGIAQSDPKRLEQACAAFRKASDLDPKCASPYHNLGFALYHLKRLHEASAAFQKASDLDPQNARNLAARNAARAGSEQAGNLNAADRAKLRARARALLQAELDRYARATPAEQLDTMLQAVERLPRWQQDADLAGVRDPKALAQLPEDE